MFSPKVLKRVALELAVRELASLDEAELIVHQSAAMYGGLASVNAEALGPVGARELYRDARDRFRLYELQNG